MKRFGVTLLFAVLAFASVTVAVAQYPPGGAPITIASSDPTPAVGETISLTIEVTGQASTIAHATNGEPILARMPSSWSPEADRGEVLAAQPFACTSAVSGGAGATVSPSSFSTDASGVATLSLFTGTQPATLTVTVQCGTLSAQAVIPVGLGGTPDAQQPGPPSTGSGATPLGSDHSTRLILLALVVLAGGGALAILYSRRRLIRKD